MTDQSTDALEHPDDLTSPGDVRDEHGQRKDGRPTGPDQDGLRPGTDPAAAPTVAPEEEGELTTTEHAPGGDL